MRCLRDSNRSRPLDVSSAGIGLPLGIHVGDAGSGGPLQWPRAFSPQECYQSKLALLDEMIANEEITDDLHFGTQHPDLGRCPAPHGRMMWVVDDNEDVVYTVRLHPDLFDEVVAGDLVPWRASMRVTGHRELTVSWQLAGCGQRRGQRLAGPVARAGHHRPDPRRLDRRRHRRPVAAVLHHRRPHPGHCL